jgi:NAD(P)-dependent dehydrogenase (short-subunit alcohol dehydrogenase family)
MDLQLKGRKAIVTGGTAGIGLAIARVMAEGFLQSLASTPNATAKQAEQEFFEQYRNSSLLQRLIEDREVANLVA